MIGVSVTEKADLLSPSKNFAVVQLPQRQFPGVVFQGDTLHGLKESVDSLEALLELNNVDELAAEIASMKELLSGALSHYEAVCAERKIPLPYTASSARAK